MEWENELLKWVDIKEGHFFDVFFFVCFFDINVIFGEMCDSYACIFFAIVCICLNFVLRSFHVVMFLAGA